MAQTLETRTSGTGVKKPTRMERLSDYGMYAVMAAPSAIGFAAGFHAFFSGSPHPHPLTGAAIGAVMGGITSVIPAAYLMPSEEESSSEHASSVGLCSISCSIPSFFMGSAAGILARYLIGP